MRINFSNIFCYNNSTCDYQRKQYNPKYLTNSKDIVSFRKSSEIPPEAIESLEQQKKLLGSNSSKLACYDLKKLEGLQNGIKVFEGLTFPQVAYFVNKIGNLLVQRGCESSCIYCMANAQTPHHMKKNNFLDKIDFEDYEDLINGLAELNKRLGFNPFACYLSNKLLLFHDGDCANIYLKDKDGNMHDYADLAKMMHDVTNTEILFDTSGWNPNDKKTQKRMEDLVQKIVNNHREYKFIKFGISINPFHSIYNKAVEFEEKGEFEKAEKLKEIYENRIANAIFTFSPLLDYYMPNPFLISFIPEFAVPQLGLIIRGLEDKKALKHSGYGEDSIQRMCNRIIEKVDKMYTDNLMSDNPNIIYSQSQKERYLDKLRKQQKVETDILLTNQKLLNKIGIGTKDEHRAPDTKSHLIENGFGILDVNGNFYITNLYETCRTNIKLNLKNKDKPTAPMGPNLRSDVIVIE